MKKIYLLILLIISIIFLITNLLNDTFAYTYDINKATLFYKENKEELSNDIKEYLSIIDDYIIQNSSFELSNYLDENYDFLVYFAMDYIITNKEYYQEKIQQKKTYNYLTKEQENKTTNQYINIEEIYKITDKYFGIKDFYIINNNVKIEDNCISLIDNTKKKFSLAIKQVEIYEENNYIKSIVSYENEVTYLYTLKKENNVLKIRNIEVV